MWKTTLYFLSLLIFLFPSTIFAEDANVQVNIKNNINSHSSSSTEYKTNIDISTSGSDADVEIHNDDFKISGQISAVSNGSFDLSNQKIYNDSSKFSDYHISGTLEVGKKTTVEGKIIDGKLYAKKISTEGNPSTPAPQTTSTPQTTPQVTTTPTPTFTTSTSPSPSPTQSPSSSPLTSTFPTSTPTPQEIIKSLNQAINILQNIVKVLDIIF